MSHLPIGLSVMAFGNVFPLRRISSNRILLVLRVYWLGGKPVFKLSPGYAGRIE